MAASGAGRGGAAAGAADKIPPAPRIEAYHVEYWALPPHDIARGDLALLRMSRAEFLAALRLFLEGGLFLHAFYVADAVLTLPELKEFVLREVPKLPPPDKDEEVADEEMEEDADKLVERMRKAEESRANELWHFYYYDDPATELRSILARRLIRAGQYSAARPFLKPEAQGWLDEYVAQLDLAKRGASKAVQADAYWKAAQLMQEHGDELADYFDPVTMAQRTSGRVIVTGTTSDTELKEAEPERFVPTPAKAEQQRIKKHATPILRRRYSKYLATDLAWRAAALMPDNDDRTAARLNEAGTWLMNRDEAAADRFYQALERRCAKTELGKEATKRRWFVPIPEPEPEGEG